MLGLLSLAVVVLTEPTIGDWRVITDDPGNAALALETSSIAGPTSRREVMTAVANRETLEAGRYIIARVTIDCDIRVSTLDSVEVMSLEGDFLAPLNTDDLGSKTAPTSDGSPSAAAFACDGVPLTTQSFPSDVEFMAWAVESQPAR